MLLLELCVTKGAPRHQPAAVARRRSSRLLSARGPGRVSRTAKHPRGSVTCNSRDEEEGMLWRYEWDDAGAELARDVRKQFVAACARGEAFLDVALAAMLVGAEDDALMSVVGIQLPIEPYLQRIQARFARMVDDLESSYLPPRGCPPEAVFAAVENYIYNVQKFRVPDTPAISAGTIVDHPGVWEDPRHAYLHCLLTRKVGCAAVLAIVYSSLMQQLLSRGLIDFAVRMDLPVRRWSITRLHFFWVPLRRQSVPAERPTPRVIPGGRAVAFVNTCTSETLVALLRQLKRAYWPFRWDTSLDRLGDGPCGSGGGFLAAALAVLGTDETDAMTTARSFFLP